MGGMDPPLKGGAIPATATRPANIRCPAGSVRLAGWDLPAAPPVPGSFLGSCVTGVIRAPVRMIDGRISEVTVWVLVVVADRHRLNLESCWPVVVVRCDPGGWQLRGLLRH